MNSTRFVLAAAAPALLLSACNSQPTVTAQNASVEEVATKAKAAVKIEPGLWSSRAEVLALDMPGMKDPRIADMMRQSMKDRAAQTNTHCLTPEEAEKPASDMFAGTRAGECRYDNFKMAGGRLDATMTCNADGGKMNATMTGTYGSTAYDMTMDAKMTNPAMPDGGMTMKIRTTGERTGECKPGSK